MNSKNRDKYYAFSIATMLTTESGLRSDLSALPQNQRSAANVLALIRNSLYTSTPGVKNGAMNVQPPTATNPEIENFVNQINAQPIIDHWNELSVSSMAVNRALAGPMDYSGSCPSFAEQPVLFSTMGAAGGNIA